MDFDKKKFKNVLHYLIFKCSKQSGVEKAVFDKLLYFSDFNFFELYETPLTNESYRKLPRGPVPVHFDLAIDELICDGKICVKKECISLGRIKSFYCSLKSPMVNLDSTESDVLVDVIDELGQMNSTELADYACNDMPFKACEENELIDYAFVFYRDFPFEKSQYSSFS